MSIEEQERELQAKLSALDGPAWDSDEDEDIAEANTLPSTKKSALKNDKRKISKKKRSDGAVLYIGHLPPNFEEAEILTFIKQFGRVLRVRVARSKRTGGSKGYAFVEMQLPQVAAIVAETMSGHIAFGQKRLVCHVVPPEKVHSQMFFKKQPFVRKQPAQQLPLEKMKAITNRLISREKKKRKAMKELGIDYDFPGYEGQTTKNQEKNTKEKKKKRKDSIASLESEGSISKKNKGDGGKKKKRKDSVDSGSRKESVSSLISDGSEADKSSTKKKKKTTKSKRKKSS